jgi:sugar phosphate isomerase/epimerase
MVPGATLTQKAERLKSWGYDGIAVFTSYDAWSADLLEEILNLKSQTGVTPCEFVFFAPCYGRLMSRDKSQASAARKMYSEAVKVCAALGAVTELEFSYGPQDPLPLFSPYAKMPPEEEKIFLKLYSELANSLAGSQGFLLLENINRYESPYLNAVSDCTEILKTLNKPNIGLLADLFHMSIEEADLPQSLRASGQWIRHVHLGDSNRLEPGKGHTDWNACIKALHQVGYDGFLNLECALSGAPELTLPRVAEYLRPLL